MMTITDRMPQQGIVTVSLVNQCRLKLERGKGVGLMLSDLGGKEFLGCRGCESGYFYESQPYLQRRGLRYEVTGHSGPYKLVVSWQTA